MNVDFLIAGQGVSGSWLSFMLKREGVSFLLMDQSDYPNASSVASGLINPITGRNYVKTWLAEELIECADELYPAFEELTETAVYKKVTIWKALHSAKDINEWSVRADSTYYGRFLAKKDIYFLDSDKFNTSKRYFKIEGGALVNTSAFLAGWRQYLIKEGSLLHEKVNPDQIVKEKGSFRLQDIRAKRIVFCEGPNALQNRYFNYLPFAVTKGECLVIKAEGLDLADVVSADISIIPLNIRDHYYVGATSTWKDCTPFHTSKMFLKLKGHILENLKIPFEIIAHYTGIRPSVKDRRPFLGSHPEIPEMYIFNGMGTKGYSLAPFFSKHFTDHLIRGKELMKEVNIERYSNGK